MKMVVNEPAFSVPLSHVPTKVLMSALSPPARIVYAVILYYGQQTDPVVPSFSVLADSAHIEKSILMAAVHELSEAKLIDVTREGDERSRAIRVLPLPEQYRTGAMLPLTLAPYPVASGPKPSGTDALAVYDVFKREYEAAFPGTEYRFSPREEQRALVVIFGACARNLPVVERTVRAFLKDEWVRGHAATISYLAKTITRWTAAGAQTSARRTDDPWDGIK